VRGTYCLPCARPGVQTSATANKADKATVFSIDTSPLIPVDFSD
jgi:hypothetical protein